MKFSSLLFIGLFISEISAIKIQQLEVKKDSDEANVTQSMKDIVKTLEKHVSKEDLKIGVLKAEKMLNNEDDQPKQHQSKKIEKPAAPIEPEQKIYKEEAPENQPHNLAHHSKPSKSAPVQEDLQAELARSKAEAASAMEKAAVISDKIASQSAPAPSQNQMKADATQNTVKRENEIVKETFAPPKAAAAPAEPVQAAPAKQAEAAPAQAEAPKAPHHHVTFEEKMKAKQEARSVEAEQNKKETVDILKKLNDQIDTIYKPKEHEHHDKQAQHPAIDPETTKDLVKSISPEAPAAESHPAAHQEAESAPPQTKPIQAPAKPQPVQAPAPVQPQPTQAPVKEEPVNYKVSSREFPEAAPEIPVARASAPSPTVVEDKNKESEYFPSPAKASDKEKEDTPEGVHAHVEDEKDKVDSPRPDFNKAVSGPEEPAKFKGNNNRNFSDDD